MLTPTGQKGWPWLKNAKIWSGPGEINWSMYHLGKRREVALLCDPTAQSAAGSCADSSCLQWPFLPHEEEEHRIAHPSLQAAALGC